MNVDHGDTFEGTAALVINFNTAPLTNRCVRSLVDAGIERVLVLDNASRPEDFAALDAASAGAALRVVRSEVNLGFAQGSNRLIEEALADPTCERVLLVNSDAVVVKEGLVRCLRAMGTEGHDLMGGRMLKPPASGEEDTPVVDSLGITIYRSLLASNRKSLAETYLGPTGGLAVYSRAFLEEARALHGHVFDPSFFCYAEDTDLCVRARLLGRSAGYVDDVVAFHEGQASNAGQYDDFILYHGIRNSIWMAAKSLPFAVLFLHAPWVVALHAGIILRHLREGRGRTLLRLYRDAIAGLPAVLRRRRAVQSSRRVPLRQFRDGIDRRFYEPGYVDKALRELFGRG